MSLFRDIQRARVCAQEALLSVDIGACSCRGVVCALNGNGGRECRTSDATQPTKRPCPVG